MFSNIVLWILKKAFCYEIFFSSKFQCHKWFNKLWWQVIEWFFLIIELRIVKSSEKYWLCSCLVIIIRFLKIKWNVQNLVTFLWKKDLLTRHVQVLLDNVLILTSRLPFHQVTFAPFVGKITIADKIVLMLFRVWGEFMNIQYLIWPIFLQTTPIPVQVQKIWTWTGIIWKEIFGTANSLLSCMRFRDWILLMYIFII